MIVRIDTTNLTRGREFTLYAKGHPDALLKALDISTGNVETLSFTEGSYGEFTGYDAVAPNFDGYLLAKVGKQKVVKKIGHPLPAFVIGYRPNFTVAYKEYDGGGNEIGNGNLTPAGDGFYWTTLSEETAVVKALNKNFIVNKNLLKMNYQITMDGGALNSGFQSGEINAATLPDVGLPDATLGEATLDSTLPNITIEEL